MTDGRIGRLSYFGRTLAISLPPQLLMVYGEQAHSEGLTLVGAVLCLVSMVFVISFGVQRLHDLERPGSHYLLLFVPFYNFYLSLCMLLERGTAGPNRYGEDPLAAA